MGILLLHHHSHDGTRIEEKERREADIYDQLGMTQGKLIIASLSIAKATGERVKEKNSEINFFNMDCDWHCVRERENRRKKE